MIYKSRDVCTTALHTIIFLIKCLFWNFEIHRKVAKVIQRTLYGSNTVSLNDNLQHYHDTFVKSKKPTLVHCY